MNQSRPVKSTLTSADYGLKMRALQEQITELKNERELKEKDVLALHESLNDLFRHRQSLQDDIRDTETGFMAYISSCTETAQKYAEIIRNSSVIINDYIVVIKEMDKRVLEAKNEYLKYIELQKETQKKIVLENEKINLKEKDLEVHRKRLEKLRDEINPNYKIT